VANTLNLLRNGAVGFIDWLDPSRAKISPMLRLCFGSQTLNLFCLMQHGTMLANSKEQSG
jgi:hypothetical protein